PSARKPGISAANTLARRVLMGRCTLGASAAHKHKDERMQTQPHTLIGSTSDPRYARCIENSRRVRWDVDKDVFRGREFDFSGHFLPDGLSMVSKLGSLTPADARLLSQIQGRTYANVFGLVERFINAKVLELSREYVLGDQVALE